MTEGNLKLDSVELLAEVKIKIKRSLSHRPVVVHCISEPIRSISIVQKKTFV